VGIQNRLFRLASALAPLSHFLEVLFAVNKMLFTKYKNIGNLIKSSSDLDFQRSYNKNRNILFVCRGYLWDQHSGITNWIEQLAVEFSHLENTRVIILCETKSIRVQQYKHASVQVIALPSWSHLKPVKFAYDFAWNQSCYSFMKKVNLDNTHSHIIGPIAGLEMYFALRLEYAKSYVLLVTPRGLDRNISNLRSASYIKKREDEYKSLEHDLCFSEKLFLVSDSHALLDDLALYFDENLPTEKIKVISIGHIVDECEIIQSTKRILYFGPLRWRKGSDLLPEVLESILNLHEEWNVVIATSGGEMADVLTRIKALSSKERVQIFSKPSDNLKHELMRGCDILLLPSRYESFGMVAAEALTHGMSVVCIPVGGLPEVVGSNAFFAGGHTVEQFIAALNDAISHVGAASYDKYEVSSLARKKFSPQRMLDEFLNLLESR